MATWKKVDSVFTGGTPEAKALKGKRVRNQVTLFNALVNDPVKQYTTDIQKNTIGVLGEFQGGNLYIAFPKQAKTLVVSLAQVNRSDFFVIKVNWITFRWQFEIEV